jgi:hypothetical protein
MLRLAATMAAVRSSGRKVLRRQRSEATASSSPGELIGRADDQHPDRRRDRMKRLDEREPVGKLGQAGVDDDDVRTDRADQVDRGIGLPGDPDDVDPITDPEEGGDGFANEIVAIDDDHADATRRV